MTDKIIVFVTCETKEQAESIAQTRRDRKARGVREHSSRNAVVLRVGRQVDIGRRSVLLLIKTTQGRFGQLQERITAMHSYEVPEIVSVAIKGACAELSGLDRRPQSVVSRRLQRTTQTLFQVGDRGLPRLRFRRRCEPGRRLSQGVRAARRNGRVRHRGGMRDQGFHATETFGERAQLHRAQKSLGADPEIRDRTRSSPPNPDICFFASSWPG